MPTGRKTDRQSFIDVAVKQEGKPYIWGAEGPNAFDCSGLISYLGNQVGLWGGGARGTADGFWKGFGGGQRINRKDIQPGDLVLYGSKDRATHVEIYAGNGQTLGASGGGSRTTTVAAAKAAGARVKRKSLSSRKDVVGFVRLPFRGEGPVTIPAPAPAAGNWQNAVDPERTNLLRYAFEPSPQARETLMDTLGLGLPDFEDLIADVGRQGALNPYPDPAPPAAPSPEFARQVASMFPQYADIVEWLYG